MWNKTEKERSVPRWLQRLLLWADFLQLKQQQQQKKPQIDVADISPEPLCEQPSGSDPPGSSPHLLQSNL